MFNSFSLDVKVFFYFVSKSLLQLILFVEVLKKEELRIIIEREKLMDSDYTSYLSLIINKHFKSNSQYNMMQNMYFQIFISNKKVIILFVKQTYYYMLITTYLFLE